MDIHKLVLVTIHETKLKLNGGFLFQCKNTEFSV